MKNLLLSILMLTSTILWSQDQILLKSGTTIETKIETIGLDKIEYRKYDNLDGPLYIIPKNQVVQINHRNGDVEKIEEVKFDEYRIAELKEEIAEIMNTYGYDDNSNSKRLSVEFEGDYLRMIVLKKSGSETNDTYLFDFSRVYKFGKLDMRKKDIAFLNIWVSLQTNAKKGKWKEEKLVIKIEGHKHASKLYKYLEEYHEILLMKE